MVLAGVVAVCNATSTADLAAAHPQSGGGYVYGSARLCPGAGRLAGVAFLVGKSASAAAAAGVFGAYVLPSAPLPAALLVVAVATALNIAGVRWTARSAYALVGGTLAVLLVVVAVGLSGRGPVDAPPLTSVVVDPGPAGVVTAAGLVFFAFAGYARIATLGGEVRDPQRTLPRAIRLALGITLVVTTCWSRAPCSSGWAPSGSPGRCPRSWRWWTRGGRRASGCSSGSGRRWRPGRRCSRCWSGSAARRWRWPGARPAALPHGGRSAGHARGGPTSSAG